MSDQMKEFVSIMEGRFLEGLTWDDRDDYRGIIEIAEEEEDGLCGNLIIFLKENPEATLQDLMQYQGKIRHLEPIEIVDDGEYDEDEVEDNDDEDEEKADEE